MGEIADMMYDDHISGGGSPIGSYPRPKYKKKYIQKERGPGPCPLCKSKTIERTNSVTEETFYGCEKFPACKGSRNGE